VFALTGLRSRESHDGWTGRSWTLIRWFLLVLVLTFLGGGVGLAVGVAIGAVMFVGGATQRVLLVSSVVLFALVPLVVLVHGLPPAFFLTPDFVRKDLPAHYVAGAALVLLILGIVRSVAVGPADLEELELATRDRAQPVGEAPPRADQSRVAPFVFVLMIASVGALVLRLAASADAFADPTSRVIASNLVAGRGFSLPGPMGGLVPTGTRMPLVPSLLALAGITGSPATAARVLWAILGAAAVPITGVAARRLFGTAAGWITACVMALLPVFWLANVRLDAAPVGAFLVSLLVLAMAPPRGHAVTPTRSLAVGAVAGGLALARPEGLVVGLAMVVAWVLAAPGGGDTRKRNRRAALTLAALIGASAVFGPWLLRNWSHFHTLLPTTGAGFVAAGANAPTAYSGPFLGSFDLRAANRARGRPSPEEEAALDRRLRAQAWSFARDHSPRLAPVVVARLLRTFEVWDPANERRVHGARGLRTKGWTAAWAAFIPLLALAGLGYARLWRRRKSLLAPLFVAPLAVAVVAIASYGEPLMRTAIDPVLVVVASGTIAEVAARVWREQGADPNSGRHRVRV